MDFIDKACEREAKLNQMALDNKLAEIKSAKENKRASEFYCVECGDSIPELRRIAIKGCRFCTACQAALERNR